MNLSTRQSTKTLTLASPGAPAGTRRPWPWAASDALLALASPAGLSRERRTSSGLVEQQRLLASSPVAVNRPAIILADEPTGNLDSTSGQGIVGFEEMHATGQTIVMITHDKAVARFATRVVQIHDGLIVQNQNAAA